MPRHKRPCKPFFWEFIPFFGKPGHHRAPCKRTTAANWGRYCSHAGNNPNILGYAPAGAKMGIDPNFRPSLAAMMGRLGDFACKTARITPVVQVWIRPNRPRSAVRPARHKLVPSAHPLRRWVCPHHRQGVYPDRWAATPRKADPAFRPRPSRRLGQRYAPHARIWGSDRRPYSRSGQEPGS